MSLTHNGLFKQLPVEVQTLVQAACEPVTLKAGQLLGRLDTEVRVYFLSGATVALVVEEPGHKSLAVGLLGADDAAGLGHVVQDPPPPNSPSALKLRVQTSGSAWAMSAITLRELALQHPALLALISRNLWQLVTHVATVAACVQTLDIHARLAAWLALSAQKARTTELHLTHEHLAHMLGVRRVSITLAAGELREQGLLHYSRGQLRILDLPGLIRASKPA
ncbi:Crp/Fnr family transcriptional regulator [Limnohabitans sp.]|uniref:Crp/Fnr family transcriptional regulator n=1 Tax=Limnohabitans sp. TaxID=1907725 RepID=UPI0025C3C2F2|nr:Crp/Fnr family transcriptional regulator [Limnohabitans sp.]